MAIHSAGQSQASSELKNYAQDFGEAKVAMQTMIEGITDDDFNWRPKADTWSIAECFDHLCMLGNLVGPKLDDLVRGASERGPRGEPPFKYGAIGNYFIKLAGPNQKRKFKAPAAYTPSSNHSISRLVKSFNDVQDRLIVCTQRAEGLDLARIKMGNPQLPILRLSLGQWFALLAGHQKRHFQQAEHVKEALFAQRGQTG